jgi:hypothetical protein
LLVAHKTSLLKHSAASCQNNEIRDATHIETRRQLGMRLSIDLQNDRLASHLGCRTRNLRRSGAARPTPVCPEIHQDRHGSILNDLVEKGRIRLQWFRYRWQLGLAGPATASARQMLSANTILLTAMGTRTDYRQNEPPAFRNTSPSEYLNS